VIESKPFTLFKKLQKITSGKFISLSPPRIWTVRSIDYLLVLS